MAELAARDPHSAERIHPNDTYRLLRALEVVRLSGTPLSSYPQNGSPNRMFRYLLLGLRRDREDLYRRIDRRCAAMFRAGLPGEVRGLFEQGYSPASPGLRAIGYREFFLEEPPPAERPGTFRFREDLPEVERLVARNSRRYAKRQMTLFASLPGLEWIDAGPEAPARIRQKLADKRYVIV
jgi:tRNA dimethylallyltransferase